MCKEIIDMVFDRIALRPVTMYVIRTNSIS